jgi:ABC-2 type transport system ATP-binding protein
MNPVNLVSYMAQLSGLTTKDAIQRTHEVLDFVALGEERYRPIESYSTGMKQKVKLAQAIVHDPIILFLDEPTNGLDPQGRDEMLEVIKKIGASGKTILVSSHILHEIEQVSQTVIIIDQGNLVKQGSTESLMTPDKTKFRIKVRGEPEAIRRFKDDIGSDFQVISSSDEAGQVSITVKGTGNSGNVFVKAKAAGIQIRYFGPDTMTLEDVFVQAFNGGEPPGD